METARNSKSLCFLIPLLFISALSTAAIYKTTNVGGVWTAPTTWQDGVMPTSVNDTVIVRGILELNVNASIGYLQVDSVATFQNANTNSQLSASIGIANYGIIQDNTSYGLGLVVSGFLYQYGIMTNNSMLLAGTNIEVDAKEPIMCSSITNPYGLTYLTVLSDTLEFVNTTVNINGCVITIDNGALILNGGALVYPDIYSDQLDITLGGGAYLQGVNFFANHIWLNGTVDTRISSFHGNGGDLVVEVNDTLQNNSVSNYAMTIDGDLINHGTIRDNNGYQLTLSITGDMVNNGTWSNTTTNLTGDNDQSLSLNQEFTGEKLTNINSNGKVIALTDLVFQNTLFDLNGDTLVFAGTADSLAMNGNNIREVRIVRQEAEAVGPVAISLTDGARITNTQITADDIFLYGVFQFESTMVFNGNVHNNGVLQNYSSYNQSATINGNIYNYGSINDNGYNLTLNAGGDILQHGVWSCEYTYLIGPASRTIDQAFAFSGVIFSNNVAGSSITLTTDFILENTNVNLNGADVTLPVNATLSVKDGILQNADFLTDGVEVFMTDGGYLNNISLASPVLRGIVQVRDNVVFSGHTVVKETLQNYSSFNPTLTVNGSLENQGVIQNNVSNLYIIIHEDVLNSGTWTNTWTLLQGYSGTIDQTVELSDGHAIAGQLRLFANNSSGFEWYWNNSSLSGNPDYSGTGSQVLQFLLPVDNASSGLYNCNTLAGWSRNIHINTTSSGYPVVDLTVFLEGPFNGMDMDTDLNDSGNLPLAHPYEGFPYNYFGPENVGAIPNSDIVDWLLIEFRDAVDAANATIDTRVDRQAAFLLADGRVVGLDGTSYLTVAHMVVNDLFVLVHHRNHLDVMSASPVIEVGGVYSYDFSGDASNSYGGLNASKNIGTDLDPVYGMLGGDSNGNGAVDEDDFLYWSQTVGTPAYYSNYDNNLDNQINNQDKNDAWIENLGAVLQYPE